MAFVRSSKFRHVFGTAFKRDKCYDNIRITKSPHDTNMCSVNGKFVAVVLEAQGGGAFLVAPLDAVGRFDINYPKVCGHKSLVMDIAWNPFNDNEIASCSEDCTVKLWDIPDGGIKENLADYKKDMVGHKRKVGHIAWHPSAANVLVSVGYDHNIIVWNTSTGEQAFTLDGMHPDLIYSISWSYDGSYLATTCKDKKIRVIDPRQSKIVAEGAAHAGNKPARVIFCGTTNKLFTTGFSRMSERQYALWDPANLSKALTMENIDTASGVSFPFWDEGTRMVYIAGKGDSTIRYFEVTDAPPYVFFLSMYQSKDPQRGMGYMPKRELEYMKCEVMRYYKLQTKGLIEPVSMTVPRKSDMFQDDIYPPTFAGKAAHSAEEWISGQNKDPLLIAFSGDGLKELSTADSQVSSPLTFTQSAGGSSKKGNAGDRPTPTTLAEYREAYKELLEENKRLRAQLGK